jgi:outer membrane protein OmpA-like peptidoglycan-associated protein
MRAFLMPPVLLALGLALAGCGGPIGSEIDGVGFGNATANNTGVQNGEIEVRIDLAERFAREVDSTVNFAFNLSRLDAAAMATLDRQADWIRQFPEVRFRVYGHTDLVGADAYNQRLGKRRADTVVNYLVSKGISRSRLEAVVSFGETQPLVLTQQPELRNRRTVTEVSGFVANHPMVLDGKYAQIIYREYVQSATRAPGNTQAGG